MEADNLLKLFGNDDAGRTADASKEQMDTIATEWFRIPQSIVQRSLNIAFEYGTKDLGKAEERYERTHGDGRSLMTEISAQDGRVTYLFTDGTYSVAVSYLDRFLQNHNWEVKKCFAHFLYQLTVQEQLLPNGRLTHYVLRYTVDDMVRNGLYTARDSALRAEKSFQSVIMDATVDFPQKSREDSDRLHVVRRAQIFGGMATYLLEEEFPWNELIVFYALFPPYFFGLSKEGYRLEELVCVMARNNLKSIQQTGGFDIDLDLIRERLGFPDPNAAGYRGKPRKDILVKIREYVNAVNNCDEYFCERYHKRREQILTLSDEAGRSAREYLRRREGKLHVQFYGSILQRYSELYDKCEIQREDAAFEAEYRRSNQELRKIRRMEKARKMREQYEAEKNKNKNKNKSGGDDNAQ